MQNLSGRDQLVAKTVAARRDNLDTSNNPLKFGVDVGGMVWPIDIRR